MGTVQVTSRADATIVAFRDRELIRDEQIQAVTDELAACLALMPGGTRLILDFDNVASVASVMLGDLVRLARDAERQDVTLQLCRLSKNVLQSIQSTHLDRVFDIRDELPER